MTRRTIGLIAALLFVAMAGWGLAQQTKRGGSGEPGKPADAEKTGIAVGEKAPPIKLRDQGDNERSLEEWLPDGTVAVIFFRSASW